MDFSNGTEGKAPNSMTTQVGRKCLSSFVSDLLYTTNKTLFSFLLISSSLDLTQIHIEALIGKQISTMQGIFL